VLRLREWVGSFGLAAGSAPAAKPAAPAPAAAEAPARPKPAEITLEDRLAVLTAL
jgi:hypothetical protein